MATSPAITATSSCPCASGQTYGACCEPFHTKKAYPPTAEKLMRARYASYVVGNVDYIQETDDPKNSEQFDRESATTWATKSEWLGLEIKDVVAGKEADQSGIVEFIARFKIQGKELSHKERSNFRKIDGKWYYIDGKTPELKPFVNAEPEVGRNDPCHCGSGKKFKKCHGK
jgi:SEC-C motif domain protein